MHVMNFMYRFKISVRLTFAFALLLALLAGMTVLAISQANRLQNNTEYYDSNLMPALGNIAAFYQGISDARRTTFLLSSLTSTKEFEEISKRYEKEVKGAIDKLNRYKSTGLLYDDKESQLWESTRAAVDLWVIEHNKLVVANRDRLSNPAKADKVKDLLLGSSRLANLAVVKCNNDWVAYRETISKKLILKGRAIYQHVVLTLVLISGAAMLIGIIGAVLITRSIVQPLSTAVNIANLVAQGDLTTKAHSRSKDELGVLLIALDQMTTNLRSMVLNVRTSTESIASASIQIAKGNSDLSTRTEQQAASLEETAASMHQMASAVHASAENAQSAQSLSSEASQVAAQGGEAVNQVVQFMAGIQDVSRKISDIISVIDGIAFQTNILALNAAVEAARAGEQGRGFAVVAGEVRGLAQRSAQAAKEIKSLITDSVEQINAGSTQAASTGATIQNVVLQVQRVSSLINDITASAAEQNSGIVQINVAVGHLDQTTQQNAALVEETSAAAESLAQQAAELTRAVAVFRVDTADARHRPPHASS